MMDRFSRGQEARLSELLEILESLPIEDDRALEAGDLLLVDCVDIRKNRVLTRRLQCVSEEMYWLAN
jgi:hypothetical protein